MKNPTVTPPATPATAPSKTAAVGNSSFSLSETIRAGQTLESLEAMRDQIAVDLELCDSMRDKAALYLRLTDVIDRIGKLRPVGVKGDVVDEIASRRAGRGSSSAAGSARAERAGKRVGGRR